MKWIIAYAVEEEWPHWEFSEGEVIPVCTGIGKVNAGMRLLEAIHQYQPDAVLNLGTVGTVHHQVGDLFYCAHFIDRDMQKLAALGLPYQINNELLPALEGIDWSGVKQGTCNTGDSFMTEVAAIEGDVVDMEAYAQAQVCQMKGIPFGALKCVTDILGQNSVKHWQDKLADARKVVSDFFQSNQK